MTNEQSASWEFLARIIDTCLSNMKHAVSDAIIRAFGLDTFERMEMSRGEHHAATRTRAGRDLLDAIRGERPLSGRHAFGSAEDRAAARAYLESQRHYVSRHTVIDPEADDPYRTPPKGRAIHENKVRDEVNADPPTLAFVKAAQLPIEIIGYFATMNTKQRGFNFAKADDKDGTDKLVRGFDELRTSPGFTLTPLRYYRINPGPYAERPILVSTAKDGTIVNADPQVLIDRDGVQSMIDAATDTATRRALDVIDRTCMDPATREALLLGITQVRVSP